MTIEIEAPATRVGDAAEPGRPVSTIENFVTLFGGLWLIAGLFIDGFAHQNIIDTATEDFFTPWHAIFYSGFIFTASWISYVMYRRRSAASIRTWIPDGYGWAVIGILLFGVGGIGDGIWHTVFGVEVGLDALLSPTHLLLFLGLVLILAAPLQAVSRNGGSTWVAVASATTLTLLVSFFTAFARPLSNAKLLTWPFIPETGGNEQTVAWVLSGIIVTTVIMVAASLYLIQRFDQIPFGAFTVLWMVPAFSEAVALSFTVTVATVSSLVGGLTLDVMLRYVNGNRRVVAIASLMVSVGIMWSAWTITQHLTNGAIAWPPEIWTGQIVLAMFAAGGIALLALPNADLPSTDLPTLGSDLSYPVAEVGE